jgi:type II secretory pathway component GspD/PulD (secretin)
MDGTDQSLREAIQLIAGYGGASITVSSDVKGTVSYSFHGTPWRAALEYVIRTATGEGGMRYALVEQEFGVLMVVPSSQVDKVQGYYRFRYLRPHAPYKGVIAPQSGGSGGSSGGSGGGGGGGSGGGGGGGGSSQSGANVVQSNVYVPSDDPGESEKNFPIVEAMRGMVATEGGEVRYLPDQNTIIFTGISTKVSSLKRMAEQLDIEPPQIFIDMNFVVTTCQTGITLGLEPSKTTGFSFGYSGSDFFHMLPFNVGGSASDFASLLTGTAFTPPSSSTFSYGQLGTSQTSLLWNFLQRDTSTKIVQAPKLLALDNQEATVFIGETIRYARTTAATNQNGGLQFSIEEDPNSPVSTGFQLLVLPHVIPGENKIMLTVIPQRRALSGRSSPLPGFDRISVGGQSIDLPRVQSTTLVTHMILRSGETALIGGLLEDREVGGTAKVPFFGDLPVLGLMFQGKDSTKVREQLLIMITPRILRGSDAANCTISDELLGRREQVNAEFCDMSGRAAQAHPRAVGRDPFPPCTPCPSAATPEGVVAAPPPPPPPATSPPASAGPMPVAPTR